MYDSSEEACSFSWFFSSVLRYHLAVSFFFGQGLNSIDEEKGFSKEITEAVERSFK